jgi:hypothetical protein
MRNSRWLLIVIFLLAVVIISVANKKATPPSANELVGAWIGFNNGGSEFTRLELYGDGSGFYAVVAPVNFISHDYGVQLYKIRKWKIEGWRISFDLSPATSNPEPTNMTGQISLSSLNLEVRGAKLQWKRQSTLHMESLLDGSNKQTRDAIAAHKE